MYHQMNFNGVITFRSQKFLQKEKKYFIMDVNKVHTVNPLMIVRLSFLTCILSGVTIIEAFWNLQLVEGNVIAHFKDLAFQKYFD